jgi:tRNA(fMet)-specific endonuclease VapC
MLDTNIVSALAREPHGAAAARIAAVGSDAVCVSVITASELRFGCEKKASRRLTTQIDAILGAIAILPFDVPADATYGRLRAALEGAGTPIGPNDLLIASHALTLGATLVTANVDQFRRVHGLRVENWLI